MAKNKVERIPLKTKYEFFKSYYDLTFASRERLRKEILDLTKLIVVLFGLLAFFFFRREQISFTINLEASVNFYNFLVFLSFVALCAAAILLAQGLFPIATKYIAGPKEMFNHWEELEDYCLTNNGNENPLDLIYEDLISSYVEAAERNDLNFIKVSKYKEYASYFIYLSLFLFYLLFVDKYLDLAVGMLGLALIAAVLLIVRRLMPKEEETENDREKASVATTSSASKTR